LAASIFRVLVEARKDVAFERCAKFYADARETFRTNCSERAVLDPLEHAHILILDDLGAGKLSDYERRLALELFECRINGERPTVVTTNWSLDEISELMDDRIASRLSLFTQLKLLGTDLRELESGSPLATLSIAVTPN
jgi:DNA replication protein DnaC